MLSNQTKLRILNSVALICSLWFVAYGWVWAYYANILFVFPVAIAGLICWFRARKINKENLFSKLILGLYSLGTVLAIASLIYMSYRN